MEADGQGKISDLYNIVVGHNCFLTVRVKDETCDLDFVKPSV
jgi:hypothetical protein